MDDARLLLERAHVALVVRLVVEADGTLVKGEVLRVPERHGPEFRTWDEFVPLVRRLIGRGRDAGAPDPFA